MTEITANVNWIAVGVGTIISFLAGWLWYSPKLFGVKWAEGVGVEMGSASEMPVAAMVFQLLGLFLMSWFVGVTATHDAILTVVLATLAFTTLAYSSGLFEKTSGYARNVNAGYWLLSLVIMIACQGIF